MLASITRPLGGRETPIAETTSGSAVWAGRPPPGISRRAPPVEMTGGFVWCTQRQAYPAADVSAERLTPAYVVHS